jgi:hypothetical protein
VWRGWPGDGGRVVGLVLVVRAPGNGRVSKRFILAGYVNRKCVLVTSLTGVLGAHPTAGLCMCKCVLVRKIIVIFERGFVWCSNLLDVIIVYCNFVEWRNVLAVDYFVTFMCLHYSVRQTI